MNTTIRSIGEGWWAPRWSNPLTVTCRQVAPHVLTSVTASCSSCSTSLAVLISSLRLWHEEQNISTCLCWPLVCLCCYFILLCTDLILSLLYRTMWSRYRNVVVEKHVFEMGNRWGKGKREWGANGEGEVSIQPTRDLSGRESHHDAKEGFQVSRKGVWEWGQGFQVKGVIKGIGLCTPISCQAFTYRANRVYVMLIKNCV